MKYLVTGKEMQLLDKNTSEYFGVPTAVLMEQAAMVFVRKLLSSYSSQSKILIISGLGNNGADGIAIGRLLNQMGISADLYTMKDRFPEKNGSELFELQLSIYRNYRFPEVTGDFTDSYDLVIDAVFGIGLTRPVTGVYADVIDHMNRLHGAKIAVDIASGIDADTGAIMGTAVKCEETITFSFGKMGQYLWPGSDYSGTVTVADMGITTASFLKQKPSAFVLEESDLPGILPKRIPHSNKGTYGRLLVIAGAAGMAGAAVFSAKAAYRIGTGLVTVFTDEVNRCVVQTLLPEAVLRTWSEDFPAEENQRRLAAALARADAVVIGPGLRTGRTASAFVATVLAQDKVPVIADADALNILASDLTSFEKASCPLVITPHLGEMARLTGKPISALQTALPDAARSYTRAHDLICVLKDFHTITACPCGRIWVNLTGNHGMATGGSGDVLSGIIGGLLAGGLTPECAAAAGVLIHGMSGDLILQKTGARSMMAADILDGIALASAKFKC